MYRTPQPLSSLPPRDETERLSIARYTKTWRLFTLGLSIVFMVPLGPVLWLQLSSYLPGATWLAATGVITFVMALTLMRQVVVVEANYTLGELTVTPARGRPQRVPFAQILDVNTDSISDSELTRVTLQLRDGTLHVVDGMVVDEPVRRIQAMRQVAERRANEAAKNQQPR